MFQTAPGHRPAFFLLFFCDDCTLYESWWNKLVTRRNVCSKSGSFYWTVQNCPTIRSLKHEAVDCVPDGVKGDGVGGWGGGDSRARVSYKPWRSSKTAYSCGSLPTHPDASEENASCLTHNVQFSCLFSHWWILLPGSTSHWEEDLAGLWRPGCAPQGEAIPESAQSVCSSAPQRRASIRLLLSCHDDRKALSHPEERDGKNAEI